EPWQRWRRAQSAALHRPLSHLRIPEPPHHRQRQKDQHLSPRMKMSHHSELTTFPPTTCSRPSSFQPCGSASGCRPPSPQRPWTLPRQPNAKHYHPLPRCTLC
ncbi:hypothetical protein H4R35_006993, partial [Dimargaris xerosporica]